MSYTFRNPAMLLAADPTSEPSLQPDTPSWPPGAEDACQAAVEAYVAMWDALDASLQADERLREAERRRVAAEAAVMRRVLAGTSWDVQKQIVAAAAELRPGRFS